VTTLPPKQKKPRATAKRNQSPAGTPEA
jgi:hypothetical protein